MALVEEGQSDTAIAKRFGVSRPIIGGIRRGKTYRAERKKPGPKSRTVEERFWDRVIIPDDPEACWGWKGASRNETSYATIAKEGRTEAAYRVSFEIHHHPIAKNEWVLHSCKNVICANPNHLYIGNREDWARLWHRKEELSEEEYEEYLSQIQAKRQTYYQENKQQKLEYVKKYQLKKKIEAIMVLGGKCSQCAETHPAALQFHHRDPSQKKFAVNSKTLSSPNKIPWDQVIEEIKKCDLLCANCHSKIHSSWDDQLIKLIRSNYVTLKE